MATITMNPHNCMRGWFFTPEEIRQAIEDRRMINPSIDLTNACNLNCPYCFIEEKESARKVRRPDELTFEETTQIIATFHKCGATTVNMVGAGEPTIDPHFKEIVELIHALRMVTVVFTNGIRLTKEPELIDFLWQHNATVVLKLNSFSKEKQDLLAGKYGYAEQRDQALKLLLEKGFNAPSPTRLGADMIAMRGNAEELAEIQEWCRRINVNPITAEYIPTGRTEGGVFQGQTSLASLKKEDQDKAIKLCEPPTPQIRHATILKILEVDRQFNVERDACPAYYSGGACTQILGLYVDISGNVWPCVARSMVTEGQRQNGLLGKIRQGADIEKIWREHAYLEQLRKTYTGGCPYKATIPA